MLADDQDITAGVALSVAAGITPTGIYRHLNTTRQPPSPKPLAAYTCRGKGDTEEWRRAGGVAGPDALVDLVGHKRRRSGDDLRWREGALFVSCETIGGGSGGSGARA